MDTDFVSLVTIPAMLVWIFWVVFSNIRRHKVAKVQAEVHAKLLDKIGSSQELLAFVNTEAGRRFLESATIEQVKTNPFGRILTSVQAGLILALLGIALLFLARPIPEGAREFTVSGTLAVALGVGFLVSAGVSYRLSKHLGLLKETWPRAGSEAEFGQTQKSLP